MNHNKNVHQSRKDCDLCPQAFATNCTLKQHNLQFHKRRSTELPICKICEQSFFLSRKCDLDRHEKNCNDRGGILQSIVIPVEMFVKQYKDY